MLSNSSRRCCSQPAQSGASTLPALFANLCVLCLQQPRKQAAFRLRSLPCQGHNRNAAGSAAALRGHQCVLAHRYGTHRVNDFTVRSRAPGRAMSCFCTAHRSSRTGAAQRSASPGATARASWRRTTTPSPTTTAPTSSPFLVRGHTPFPVGLPEWLLLCLVHRGHLWQHVPQPLPHRGPGHLWCMVSPLFPARSCDHVAGSKRRL